MDDRSIVLVVEDNRELLNINARVLEQAGYEVLRAATLTDACALLQVSQPDVVVLDILLPDGNGLDFIPKLREKSTAPVLLVTSLGSKDDRLIGLRAGGDDYITKPYDLDELVARVAAFLRREALHHKKTTRTLEKGQLSLDLLAGRAYLQGRDMRLTPKEFALLQMFLQSEVEIIPAERLYEDLWHMPMAGDNHSVKNTVYRLRKKLENGGSDFTITSVRGRGYRFERV